MEPFFCFLKVVLLHMDVWDDVLFDLISFAKESNNLAFVAPTMTGIKQTPSP